MDTKMVQCPRCAGSGYEPPALAVPCGYCAGFGRIEDLRLSPNFWFSEWCRPHAGCPNDPPPDAVARAKLCLQYLVEPGRAKLAQLLSREVALDCHSGYRCPPLDVLADAGNTVWLRRLSAHALGSALDLYPHAPATLPQLLRALIDGAAVVWDQLIAEGGCIHAALEGPDDNGKALPPGGGRRRKQIMFRRLRIPADGPGGKYAYEHFDGTGTPELWARVV